MMQLLTLAQMYRPFVDPLPIHSYWYWLLLPLTLLFSVVYKAVKCEKISDVPKQTVHITFLILVGMAGAAAVLTLIVWITA